MNTLLVSLCPPFLWYEQLNYSAPYRSRLHCHPAWQLTCAVRGEFYFEWDEQRTVVKPGEWILFPPEFSHIAGSECRETQAMQIFFRHFPPHLLPEFSRAFNFRRNFFLTGAMPSGAAEWISSRFESIEREHSRIAFSLKTVLPLQFITEALGGGITDLPVEKEFPAEFFRVLEYMEEHFAEPLGVPDFAEFVQLSPSRFTAVFSRWCGLSPMDYFNEIRLSRAQIQLLSGESVKNTACNCGFASVSYFCRKFKKYTGKTPGEFCLAHHQTN